MGTDEETPADARTRVAVVDLGTNSTRLLVADVDDGRISEVARRSEVTRLGRGVDLSGQLSSEAMEGVFSAVDEYVKRWQPLDVDAVAAIATSAVRDASNGEAFLAELRERFALSPRVISGDEEAQLSYLGATAERSGGGPSLVCDIGGGSTELIVGSGPDVRFFSSLPIGVVRQTERHIKEEPEAAAELEELANEVRAVIDGAVADQPLASAADGIAVGGTATSLASIDLELEAPDPRLTHGHQLPIARVQRICSELSAMTLEERRAVTGLNPARAPTIVAGVVILIQVMRAFDLGEIEVSERDILHGAALEAAASA